MKFTPTDLYEITGYAVVCNKVEVKQFPADCEFEAWELFRKLKETNKDVCVRKHLKADWLGKGA